MRPELSPLTVGFAMLLPIFAACSRPAPAQEPTAPTPAPSSVASGGSANGGGAATDAAVPSPSTGGANGGTHEKMCGGIAGIQCPAKQYCAYAPEAHCGAADMSGTCAPVPDVCAEVMDEVCGCDDKTYGNACKAAQAGVSVVMKGACAKHDPPRIVEGATCGTRGVPGDCAEDLYCAYKSSCGATDAGGVCTKKPKICTKIYAPVCGCDNHTYASACTAASAGQSVMHPGACKG